MNQALHIIRKDLRRLRWLLAGWTLVLAARVVLDAVGSTWVVRGFEFQMAIEQLSSFARLVEVVMLTLIASAIVHDEPLVGLDAFWLTRPIDRIQLLAAKAGLATTLLIVAPVLRESVTMFLLDVPAGRVVPVLPLLLRDHALWAVPLVALASVTPSPTRYLLAIAGLVAAFFVLVTVVITFGTLWLDDDPPTAYMESYLSDPTPAIVSSLVFIFAAVAVIVFQYRRRQWKQAVSIGVAGVVALIVVPGLWPWPFAMPAEPDPGAWARDTRRVTATIDRFKPPHRAERYALRPNADPRVRIAAPIELNGVPFQYSVEAVGVRARVDLAGGVSLTSAQRDMAGVKRPAESPARSTPLSEALGGARVLDAPDEGFDLWPVVLVLRESEYERHRRTPGRLSATVDFYMRHTRVVDSVPLARGATAWSEGQRLDILRVLQRAHGCTLYVRRVSVQPAPVSYTARRFQYVLRNRARGEALVGHGEHGMIGAASVLPIPFGITIGSEGFSGFSVQSLVLDYPASGASGADPVQVDAAWLSGAELAIVENAYAGRVQRTLAVEGFRMEK